MRIKNNSRAAWVLITKQLQLPKNYMIATTTLLLLINAVRPPQFPLTINYELQQLAEKRCLNANSFSHEGFWNTYAKLGNQLGFAYVGENLSFKFTDAESAFKALENSSYHKKNNHSLNYQKVGISVCQKSFGNNFTVILFAGH